jgi:signal transduction histidine kinase
MRSSFHETGRVKDHGGELKVESEVGRGTTVTVELPINLDRST